MFVLHEVLESSSFSVFALLSVSISSACCFAGSSILICEQKYSLFLIPHLLSQARDVKVRNASIAAILRVTVGGANFLGGGQR